ncbi:MAG: glycosyltransferase family 39 protein, partial [Burkholderiaceae bacterium]
AFLRYRDGGVHRHGYLPWLVLVVVVMLASGIGLRDPWPADEPRFALVAQEMLVTGKFWIPHRGGELYADKPPIFIWLTAAAIALTGSVRTGFLLPSLVAGLATFAMVVDLVRRLYGSRVAWLAGAALAANVQFVLQAKTAQIDMVLTCWTTLGAYGLLRHALLGPAPGWWLVGWAAAGLGILSKGVGFLPLLMLPAWYWLAARGRVPRLSRGDIGRGVLTLLAVVAAWGLPMIVMAGFANDPALAAYRDNILFRQTGRRYAAAWHHLKPWYFFVVEVIPWAWLPMLFALPWALPAWVRRMRRNDPRIVLPLTGVVLIVLFFSLSPGKRGVYILPTVPLLVIALAPLLPGLVARVEINRIVAAALGLLALVLLAAGAAGLSGQKRLVEVVVRYEIDPFSWLLMLGIAAVALIVGLRPRRGLTALMLWLPAFWVSYALWMYPQLNGTRSPGDLMAEVARRTGPQGQLALPDFDEEFLLQARQPSVHFGRETALVAQLARAYAWLSEAPGSRWMLIEQRRRLDLSCVALDQAIDLGHQNRDDWWLIPGTAFASCRGDTAAAPLFVAPTTAAARPAIPP